MIIATCAGGATPLTIPERITDLNRLIGIVFHLVSKAVSQKYSHFRYNLEELVLDQCLDLRKDK